MIEQSADVRLGLCVQEEVKMHLPARIGDYTDFYACQEHARNAAGIRTGLRVLTSNWSGSLELKCRRVISLL